MMSAEEAEERGIGAYRGMVIVLPWLLGGYSFLAIAILLF